MGRTLSQLKSYRRRLGWAFVISIAVLFTAVLFIAIQNRKSDSSGIVNSRDDVASVIRPDAIASGPDPINLSLMISATSLLTSVTSFLGLIITTAVAWRKERREQLQADVELQRKNLEVEKLRLEIGRDVSPARDDRTGTTGN
jgi:hypothetical protein